MHLSLPTLCIADKIKISLFWINLPAQTVSFMKKNEKMFREQFYFHLVTILTSCFRKLGLGYI